MITALLPLMFSNPELPFARRQETTYKLSRNLAHLSVKTTNGSVRVIEGRSGQIVVKCLTRADELSKLEETTLISKVEKGVLRIEVQDDFKTPMRPSTKYPGAVDYTAAVNDITITVPPKCELDINSSNASVEIGRIEGHISVQSKNGAIKYAAVSSATVAARTRNGKVRSAVPTNISSSPSVVLESNNGDITIEPSLPELLLRGAKVWNGKGFAPENWYVVDGRFTRIAPKRAAQNIDFTGRYLSPAYGDAHCHHIDGDYLSRKMNSDYLSQGTVYVQSMGNHVTTRMESNNVVNRNNSIDVAFANAGFTSLWGHPVFMYETLANPVDLKLSPKERSDLVKSRRRTQLGDTYWLIEKAEDIERVWPRYLASDPDLTKIFLVNSKHRSENINGLAGSIGLAPQVVPFIVKRAHESGLRVYVHVDTAEDFYIAMRAGVDGYAHMPGYGFTEDGEKEVTLDPRQLKSDRSLIVQPTVGLNSKYANPSQSVLARKLQAKNVSILRAKGVQFAVGSDIFFETQKVEALAWLEVGFNRKETFQALTTTTPQSIFPLRAIGRISEGYEATFVVLGQDPLKDLNSAFAPTAVWKHGREIFNSGSTKMNSH